MFQKNPNPTASETLMSNERPFLSTGWRKQSFWKLGRKLLLPSVAVMTMIGLGLMVYIDVYTIQRNQAEVTKDLGHVRTAVESDIASLQTLSLGLATEMANNPQVQAAFAAQDRSRLTEIALPTFQVVQEEFDVKQYQFILPPATSFLRLHQLDKYGDDLSAFRFTVLEANSTQKPVSGVEIGRGGLGIRGEVPVFYQDRYIGVIDVGIDIGPAFLESLKNRYGVVAQILLEKEAAQTATFAGATSDVAGPSSDLLLQASTFSAPLYGDPTSYKNVLKGETSLSNLKNQGQTYAISTFPITDYSGKVIGVLEIFRDRTEAIAVQSRNLILSALVSLLAMVAGGMVLVRLINNVIQPINVLTETAIDMANGNLERQVAARSEDEIGQLSAAFNSMTSRLRKTLQELEQRVADRTRNLELAAKVGRSISQVRELRLMLKDAAELIRSQFDLYYVQVYLTNPSQTALILESGTGSVGAELIARGHHLPLNTTSINGRAAMEKHAVVISDTATSATFRPNSMLPDTRGEMAVPLLVGETVVGVLDMQTRSPGTLNENLLPAFEALAGQLAIAIQNANLLAEAEQARAETEKQARRLARASWDSHLDAIHAPEQTGFTFERNEIYPLVGEERTDPNAVSAPIAVAGEKLGSLVVELDEGYRTDQNMQLVNTIAQQVAQQIENLRILESAERYRREAEEAARRTTVEGWQEFLAGKQNQTLSYLYDLNQVKPNSSITVAAEASALSIPIKVRDETMGKVVVFDMPEADPQALDLINETTQRLSAHLDNLRLSQQTQESAQREHALRQFTSAVRASNNAESILRTAVRELGNMLGRKTIVQVRLSEQGNRAESAEYNGNGSEPTVDSYKSA